jgi:calcium-dependent protein kinase
LDGNGVITKNEITDIFGGDDVDEGMWKEILTECDKNSDGMVWLDINKLL